MEVDIKGDSLRAKVNVLYQKMFQDWEQNLQNFRKTDSESILLPRRYKIGDKMLCGDSFILQVKNLPCRFSTLATTFHSLRRQKREEQKQNCSRKLNSGTLCTLWLKRPIRVPQSISLLETSVLPIYCCISPVVSKSFHIYHFQHQKCSKAVNL